MSALEKEYERLIYYQSNPIDWAVDYMGLRRETLIWSMNPGYEDHEWDGDIDPAVQLAEAVSIDGDRRIANISGNALGKTHSLAWIPLWFLDVWKGSRVITLAPKEDQLKKNLWKEVRKNFWEPFRELHPQAELYPGSLELRMDPGRESSAEWKMLGYAAGVNASETTASKARGFHAEHMLIIMEEATGIHEAVFKAFKDTATAPHNIIILAGNPDSNTDPLGLMANAAYARTIRWSAYDHPNVVMKSPGFVPGAVTIDSIKEKLEDAGGDKQDGHFQSRVRGLIPTVSSDSLYSSKALRNAEEHLKRPVMTIHHDDEANGVEGFTKIYRDLEKNPVEFLAEHILFMDVAGENPDGDFHAAVLWNRLDRKPDAIVKMRGLGQDYIKACTTLAKRFKVRGENGTWAWPLIVWETNGVGAHFHNMSDELKSYPNVYFERNLDSSTQTPRKKYGFRTTKGDSGTRRKMITELQTWARELVHWPDRMVSREILEEARVFVQREWRGKKKRYMAAPGYHDDLQMALGGAMVVDRTQVDPIRVETRQKTSVESSELSERARRAMKQSGSGEDRDPFDVPFSKLVSPSGRPLQRNAERW